MHVFGVVAHYLICAQLRGMWGSIKSHAEIKAFQRYFLSPVCENLYCVTGREEFISAWFVLDCCLSHCYFLGAHTPIFLILKKNANIAVVWFPGISLHEQSVTTANASEVVQTLFHTWEWNLLGTTDVKTANLFKFFLVCFRAFLTGACYTKCLTEGGIFFFHGNVVLCLLSTEQETFPWVSISIFFFSLACNTSFWTFVIALFSLRLCALWNSCISSASAVPVWCDLLRPLKDWLFYEIFVCKLLQLWSFCFLPPFLL